MKIIYVTGCLGLIGSNITRICLQKGWYVIGVDVCTYVANLSLLEEFNKYKNFKFLNSDINDLDILYDCDYIINTAAETHVANSLVDSSKFFKTNIIGVEKLLNLIKKLNNNTSFPTLIHFSSYEVYGNNNVEVVNEKSMLNPLNPYSATKASADMIIKAFSATYNIPYIIVRPNCNYGLGQYVEKLIPKFCKYALLKKKFPLHNGGLTTRTWVNSLDTANAILSIIENNVKNEIFNVSSNFEISNLELCNSILNVYYPNLENKDDFYDFTYSRGGQNFKFVLDDSKIRSLGWKETVDFNKEIINIANYHKENFIW
jgi:dTDP-glucose 4,6-dehydratase